MPHMRWSLKFTAKGKKDGAGTGPGKRFQGATDSFRNGVGTGGHQSFRSGSDVDRSDRDNDHDRESGANNPNSRTPIVTPPDANGGGRAESGQSKSAEPGQETEGHNSSPPFTVDSAGREGAVGEGGNGGETDRDGQQRLEDMDENPGRVGGDDQDDVFDDESQEDADSLHASKTARMKSFADDPEAHALGDLGADWDGEALHSSSGGKGDSGEEEGMRRGDGDRRSPVSRGDDRFSGNDGGGSDSYHSETEAPEDGYDASSASPGNPSRGRTSTEGAKSGTFNSFGGISANGAVEAADDRERLRGRRVEGGAAEDDRDGDNGGVGKRAHDREGQDNEGGQEVDDELGDGDDDDDGEEDEEEEEGVHGRERHYEVDDAHRGVVEAPGDRDDGYGDDGYGREEGGDAGDVGDDVVFESRVRDHLDPERRAHAHAYVDDLDNVASRVEMPGYGGAVGDEVEAGAAYGSDRKLQQQRNAVNNSAGLMPPAPPGAGGLVVNGISPVDARAAAALAARTRLAAGGMLVPGVSGQRPEPGAVVAAAAAAAALRRGPTPGSHSLPSMVLVPLEALKAHRKVPRSSDRRALVRYRDLPDRSRSFVVFVSHAWMRPHTTPSFAHPDTSSRGGEKYRLIAEAGDRIRAHLPPDVRVLLWIDYSCVDQDSTRRSKATMRGMREYMRRCDAILTVYPGEAADNGEEFLPNRFVKSCAWAGSYKSLAHYCTRGWCRLEMLLGQTEPLPQDGFMFNFLVPKKKKASGAKNSVGDRPHFLYGAHQRPHNGRIDVVPRQSSRWFEEHHPEQGNFTHESDRDAIRTVLAKQTNTMAKRTAAIAARYGTDPRRGGGSTSSRSSDRQQQQQQHYVEPDEYGRPHPHN